MYSLEFLKSLGLDPKIWNAGSVFREVRLEDVEMEVEDKADNRVHELPKTGLPKRCLNCLHGLSLDIGDFCKEAEIFIDDPEKEISCDSFQRVQCKNCGLYEEGFCFAHGDKIAKDSEDECEYDAIEFL